MIKDYSKKDMEAPESTMKAPTYEDGFIFGRDRGGQTEEDRRGGIAYSSSWKGGFQPLLLFGGISTLLAIKGGFLPN